MRISDWSSDVCSSDLEDAPRVTIRGIASLDNLAKRTRINLEISLASTAALPMLSLELERVRGGRGEVVLRLMADDIEATLNLGRKYALDAEIAARIEYLPGVTAVTLKADEQPRLALVRSEERRAGKECVGEWRTRGSPFHQKKKNTSI